MVLPNRQNGRLANATFRLLISLSLREKFAGVAQMSSASWSLTRQEYGEQPFWMLITLAAMVGRLDCPAAGSGCGILL